MNEYVMVPEGGEEVLGLTFDEETHEEAIERAKEAMPGLKAVSNVWNLRFVCREDPERHVAQDSKGGFYEVFVKQLILEDEETGEVTLAG